VYSLHNTISGGLGRSAWFRRAGDGVPRLGHQGYLVPCDSLRQVKWSLDGGPPLRDSAVFGRAFLDGFTVAGLIGKVGRPGAWKLDFKPLTDALGTVDFKAIQRVNERTFRSAMSGLLWGFLVLAAMLGSTVYLVIHSHPVMAGSVLGTWALAMLGDSVWKYLSR